MKSALRLTTALAFTLFTHSPAHAQEKTPDSIEGLRTAAAAYLTAYNSKDAEAVAALFTEDGEISDLTGKDIIAGRNAIREYYTDLFSQDDLPLAAVEVASVRLVAPNLAIEDGTVHLTPTKGIQASRSMKYTAALVKDDAGKWLIGSTRDLSEVTPPAGQLSGLAEDLIGKWTSQNGPVAITLSFNLDKSGNFILGKIRATSPGTPPQTGTMRIGWDGARDTITWWNFDSEGGFSKGDWSRTPDGWFIRSSGTTATGEPRTANQYLTFENPDTVTWTVKDRMINGEFFDEQKLHVVRQTSTTQAKAKLPTEATTSAE